MSIHTSRLVAIGLVTFVLSCCGEQGTASGRDPAPTSSGPDSTSVEASSTTSPAVSSGESQVIAFEMARRCLAESGLDEVFGFDEDDPFPRPVVDDRGRDEIVAVRALVDPDHSAAPTTFADMSQGLADVIDPGLAVSVLVWRIWSEDDGRAAYASLVADPDRVDASVLIDAFDDLGSTPWLFRVDACG